MPVSFHSQKKISQSKNDDQNSDQKTLEKNENLENKINQNQENKQFQIKNSSEPNAVHRVKIHLSKIVDKGIYVIAALGPLSAFDQVWQIWAIGNTNGVSLLMWLSWIPGAIFWLIYGILHKDKPIILTQSLWLVMQLAIVSGLLLKN